MIREFLATFSDHYNANRFLSDNCTLIIGATTTDTKLPTCVLSQETGGSAIATSARTKFQEKYVFSFQGDSPNMITGNDSVAGADDIIEEITDHFDGERLPLGSEGKAVLDIERSTVPFIQFDEDSDVWLFGVTYEFSVTRIGRIRTD